jgi:hypothetical protein
MAYISEDDDIECEIIEFLGVFSEGNKSWNKELNFVSWNGRPAKLDIRSWQKDHKKCGKGIAITMEEAEELAKLLNKFLKTKPGEGKSKGEKPRQESKARSGKKPVPPITLEPFYDELELAFGTGPDKCKSARNTLLKKYHPDKNAANIAFATRKTIKIKEAYDRITAWWNENYK